MAKPASKTKPRGSVVPMKNSAGVPAHVRTGKGRGLSTSAEDNIVPLIYVAQSNSPYALRQRKDVYVPGIEPGDIWLRGTRQFFKGGEDGEGVIAQACHFSKAFIEWKPSRGGFVARHHRMPEDAVLKDVKGDKGVVQAWVRPSGNIVSQSNEYAVRLYDEDYKLIGQYVFPFGGGKIGSSRQWMSKLTSIFVDEGERADIWACYWRLKTVPLHNDQGDWFGLNVEPINEDGSPAWVSVEDLKAGERFFLDLEGGKLRADVAEDEELETEDV